MKKIPLTLYLEINNFNFIFLVGESNSYENFKIIYKMEVSTEGIEQNRIIDLEKTFNIIKKNIFLIEQKLNYTVWLSLQYAQCPGSRKAPTPEPGRERERPHRRKR